MREAEKQYQLCKDACENMGCYCPKECEFHQKVANTNAWIRAYFFMLVLRLVKKNSQTMNLKTTTMSKR